MGSFLKDHDWNFWMWWVAFTAVASTACFVIIGLAFFWLSLPFAEKSAVVPPTFIDQLAGSLFFALAGAAIAAGQWLALRMIMPRSARWILAGGAGWLAGYWSYLLVYGVTSGLLHPALLQLLPWLIIGLWSGLFQWLFLRHHYPRADIWLPVSLFAILIGAGGWSVGSICGGILSWAAAGAITGYTMLKFEASRLES